MLLQQLCVNMCSYLAVYRIQYLLAVICGHDLWLLLSLLTIIPDLQVLGALWNLLLKYGQFFLSKKSCLLSIEAHSFHVSILTNSSNVFHTIHFIDVFSWEPNVFEPFLVSFHVWKLCYSVKFLIDNKVIFILSDHSNSVIWPCYSNCISSFFSQ